MRRVLASMSAVLAVTWVLFFPDVTPKQVINKYRCPTSYAKMDAQWTKPMSQAYARIVANDHYKWGAREYAALVQLWDAESHWNPRAYNTSVERNSGKNAGGIPQLLGLDPKTPAPVQIDRGLAYISSRYGKPSVAWHHHKLYGWY